MFSTFRKELLLILRDPSGLLLLLIMPTLLLVIMTYVQDAPFRDYQELKFEVLILNKDKGKVSNQITKSMEDSKNFLLIDSLNGLPLTEAQFLKSIKEGHYQVGLIIPENTTKIVVKATNNLANDIAQSSGLPTTEVDTAIAEKANIQIVYDPLVKPAMRTSLTNAIQQYLLQSKFDIVLDRLGKMSGNEQAIPLNQESFDMISVSEEIANEDKALNAINSVQHNVPAWAIFGMFMIVVPIAGNFIRERDEGSAMRINLIPRARYKVMLGKMLFYLSLCLMQLTFMLSVGLFFLPILGLPSLELGAHPLALIPLAVAIAFSAVAYGVFIGKIFKTSNQAMPFGAISIVILSAIGGIWVPLEILPNVMQKIALVSPLHWALEGINGIFLRNMTLLEILPSILALIVLGTALLWIAHLKKSE